MIPALLALVMVGAALALTQPAASPRIDVLPRPVVDLQRPVSRR